MFESEERRIAQRIKEYIKDEEPPRKVYITPRVYIISRNGRILYIGDYRNMVSSGKINPHDAYVYFDRNWTSYNSTSHYPFLSWDAISLDVYLSKLGFYNWPTVVPATGLKYVALVISHKEYLSIEVANLDTVVNNTNLRTITSEVLGEKLISGEKVLTDEEYEKILEKILDMFRSQRLFAGHDFGEADTIISKYYDEGNKSLAKEVARIAMDYYRIFQPYTVCYDMKTWKELDCWSIT